jgi:hypothetical protein
VCFIDGGVVQTHGRRRRRSIETVEEVVGEEEDREMKQKGSRWLHTVLALLAQ